MAEDKCCKFDPSSDALLRASGLCCALYGLPLLLAADKNPALYYVNVSVLRASQPQARSVAARHRPPAAKVLGATEVERPSLCPALTTANRRPRQLSNCAFSLLSHVAPRADGENAGRCEH